MTELSVRLEGVTALVLTLLWCATALGQLEPGAVVAGRITSQEGGAPVRKADVTLHRVDVRPSQQQGPLTTRTDGEGRFLFPGVPSGHYRLVASANGYEQVSYGARSSNQPGRFLLLGPNETHLDANIALRPTGVISGAVTDGEGEPLRHVQVSLLQTVYDRGKVRYQPTTSANTNDRGQYRLFGVRAGSYRVMVGQVFRQFAEPSKTFVPQFYPNSPRLEGAEVLKVTPGKEFRNINFQMTAVPMVRLKGKLAPASGLEINAPVQLNLMEEDAPGFQHHAVTLSLAPPNFEFEQELRPGRYLAIAQVSAGDRHYHAAEHADVGPGGLDEFTLALEAPVEVKGTVRLEGEGAPKYTVRLSPAGNDLFPVKPHAVTKEDGTFVLSAVPVGLWNVDAQPVPRGGYLKSVRLGEEDVTNKDLNIAKGGNQPLNIVISTKGATLDGEVDIPETHVGLEASVLLAPEGELRGVSSRYILRGINMEGEFHMEGIPPGSYRIYAFAELNHRAYQDPEFLKPFAEHGVAIEIKEGERAKPPKRVPLIPPGVIPLE